MGQKLGLEQASPDASGLYSAAFDSPTIAPGYYDIQEILQLPYGEAYLAAILVKPLAWLALV